VILVDSHPRHESLEKAVTKRLREELANLSQLGKVFAFFALIFIVRPCVFIVAL
jgi:hypothetical protein